MFINFNSQIDIVNISSDFHSMARNVLIVVSEGFAIAENLNQ